MSLRLFFSFFMLMAITFSSDFAAANRRTAPRNAGGTCHRGETNANKCMVCVVAYEGLQSSVASMTAVGRTVMTRVKSSQYPNSICGVVYQIYNHKFQFSAMAARPPYPTGEVLKNAQKAAAQAMRLGPNGKEGFRTAVKGKCARGSVLVGGNCFRRGAELEEDQQVQTPLQQTAELIQSADEATTFQ